MKDVPQPIRQRMDDGLQRADSICACVDEYHRTKKILIVDDDADDRETLRHTLAEFKTEITECNNGQAALKLIRENDFDFVFMDKKMPGMDGMDVLRQASDCQSRTRFVLLTGHTEFDEITILAKPAKLASLERLFHLRLQTLAK